ncbi:MAG: DUF1638 domain-containing protein [Lysobacterales bacterium]
MQDKILVIGCGAIARELVRIRRLNHWDHIDIQCLPPGLHNRPERIPASVRVKIDSQIRQYRKIFVAYADCGTGGALDVLLDEYGIDRIPGAHCYEFFTGEDAFRALAETEPGSFYLTDFLTRHFERLVIKGLGIDRLPQLKSVYFNNYRRLVYLAQSDTQELQTMARRHAQTLGLSYTYHYCGETPLSGMLKPALEH